MISSVIHEDWSLNAHSSCNKYKNARGCRGKRTQERLW